MRERYIIDANVFIQAKNLHYGFAFCMGFWDWIRAGFDADVIFTTEKVRSELVAGHKDDALRVWAQAMPKAFFLNDEKDLKVMQEYAVCMQWAYSDTHYLPKARQTFAEANRADAFLLAYARAYGHSIVTHEISNPEKKKEIPIPDAARKIGGIKTVTIYELLRKHARGTFEFYPDGTV